MAERTTISDIHRQKETPEAYLNVPRPFSFVAGRQRSRMSENGSDESRYEALLHWLPRSPDLTSQDFYYGNTLRRLSFWGMG